MQVQKLPTLYKHNKSGEKLASVCIESSGTAYKCNNSAFLLAIIATPIDHAHYICACIEHVPLLMHTTDLACIVGKDHQ